jgi:hypothetical protein
MFKQCTSIKIAITIIDHDFSAIQFSVYHSLWYKHKHFSQIKKHYALELQTLLNKIINLFIMFWDSSLQ